MGVEMALIAATTAISIGSQIKQGMNDKAAGNAEAGQLIAQANQEKQAAGAKIASDDYEAEQSLARVTANAGAAGVTMAGSPGEVLNRSAEEAKINDMYTRYSGRLAAVRDLYAADVAKYKGSQAAYSSYVGAGQSLISGLIKANDLPAGKGGGFLPGIPSSSSGTGSNNSLGGTS